MGYPDAKPDYNDLVIKYIPLVKRIVGRIDPGEGDLDKDDLFSIGVIGLIDALKKFDPRKAVPFEAYATLRIKGNIIDEMRRTCLLYTSPSPRDRQKYRMPSSA